jgi:hypothetical protein
VGAFERTSWVDSSSPRAPVTACTVWLSSAYAGQSLEADCFPIGDELHVDRSLFEIVTETVVEGCIGETLAAQLRRCVARAACDAESAHCA